MNTMVSSNPHDADAMALRNELYRSSWDGLCAEYRSLAGQLRAKGMPWAIPTVVLTGDKITKQHEQLLGVIEQMRIDAMAPSGAPAALPPPPSNKDGPRLDRIEEQIIATGGLVVEALGILLAQKKGRMQ
jgi:hypothetical protein